MNAKFIGLIAGAALIVCSCGSKEEAAVVAKRKITPPVPSVDLGKHTFAIDPTKDTTLTTESGSTIFIPANTLATADKKTVEDKALVEYEEYMNQADIILSGIPMQYDSAGQSHFFESAGMFNIEAKTPEGENLVIAAGKSVTVSQNSPWEDQGSAYNFYQFDKAAGEWKYIDTRAAEPAAPKPTVVETEKTAKAKVKKSAKTNNDFVFDINVNFSVYTELANMKNIMWKYSGNKKYKDPEKEQWIFERNWPETKIVRDESQKGAYIITLKSSNATFTTSVVPVSVDPATAGNVQMLAEKTVGQMADQTEQILNNAETFQRVMQLQNLGLCNWDVIYRLIRPKKVKVNFLADGSSITEGYRIYQVFTRDNAVRECPLIKGQSELTIPDLSQEFVLVAVNAKGDALVAKNMDALVRARENEIVDFSLKRAKGIVKSSKDLLNILFEV